MKIFTVGSINMDLVIRTEIVPQQGMTVSGHGFMQNPGGKGANQATAVAKLGGNSWMVGCVGNAFGNELKGTLSKNGVETEFVRTENSVSDGIAIIVISDGDNRIILDRGANGFVTRTQIDDAFETAERGDYLVVQLEINMDAVEYALKKAKEKGMITVLNPAPAAELSESVFRYCDYFIPNQSEAEFYTDIAPIDDDSALRCAQKLRKCGVETVLITMGCRGAVCISGNKICRAKAYPVKAVDTTAAGDTYVGAFVVGLSEGMEIESAMDFASKASAITVTKVGAQQAIPQRIEVENFKINQ